MPAAGEDASASSAGMPKPKPKAAASAKKQRAALEDDSTLGGKASDAGKPRKSRKKAEKSEQQGSNSVEVFSMDAGDGKDSKELAPKEMDKLIPYIMQTGYSPGREKRGVHSAFKNCVLRGWCC